VIDGREHGLQTIGPGGGAEHEIDLGVRRHPHETVPSRAHKAPAGQRTVLPQAIERLGGRHRDRARLIPRDLAREAFGILARGQTDHTESVGVGVDNGEGTLPDRARGPENGDAFQSSALGYRLFRSFTVDSSQLTVL
jgi:hypothetical protein